MQNIKAQMDIRISDCKDLKPYGMSLFPFWLHTQSKLKCLEASIHNAEISLPKSALDSIEEEVKKETCVTSPGFENSNQISENGGEEKEKEVEEKEMEIGQEEKEIEREEVRDEETMLPIEDVEMEIEEDDFMTNVSKPNSDLALTLEEGEVPPPPSSLPDDRAPPPPPPEDEPVPPPPEDELVPPPPPEEPSVSYSVVAMIPPYQHYTAVPTYNYSASAGGYTQPHYYDAYYNASAQVSAPVMSSVAQAVPVTNAMLEPTVYNYAVPVGQRATEVSAKPESSSSVFQAGSYVGAANESLVSSASQAVETVYVAGDLSAAGSSAAAPSAVVSFIASSSAAVSSAAMPSAATLSSVAPPAVSKDQPKGIFVSL
jgi:formin-binding protein 4